MMMIAIDGPAGAGKSTMAKLLAKRLNIQYMDTGAMYRALACAMMQRGQDPADQDAVRAAAGEIGVSVEYKEDGQHVYAEGEDLTPYIRTREVSRGASDVAVVKEVRMALAKTQRETAEKYDIVMDGRDIGTYVLPHAPVKFYVTASPRERARRRAAELIEKGTACDIDEIEREIAARDQNDAGREFAPLKQADDAVLIDTTNMEIDSVLEEMLRYIGKVYPDVL